MGTDPKSWAEAFVAELSVGGERVPFERVLARHIGTISDLRSKSGLTWRSLASLLTRAGARRAAGSMISADQLRVGHARLVRHAAKAAEKLPIKRSPQIKDRRVSGLEPSSVIDLPISGPRVTASLTATERVLPQSKTASPDREDVSDDEIASALSRLIKLPSKP